VTNHYMDEEQWRRSLCHRIARDVSWTHSVFGDRNVRLDW